MESCHRLIRIFRWFRFRNGGGTRSQRKPVQPQLVDPTLVVLDQDRAVLKEGAAQTNLRTAHQLSAAHCELARRGRFEARPGGWRKGGVQRRLLLRIHHQTEQVKPSCQATRQQEMSDMHTLAQHPGSLQPVVS